jgi:hypothetical protein
MHHSILIIKQKNIFRRALENKLHKFLISLILNLLHQVQLVKCTKRSIKETKLLLKYDIQELKLIYKKM